MITLTPEQRVYKQRTLEQLLHNQQLLETSLENESRPRVVKSIQRQMNAIEAHISRLQDELTGNVVFDEPVADELFKKAAGALAREKFFLARRHITKLETIEPFYPGIERLRREAENQQVSRRTRSIAEGKSRGYGGNDSLPVGVVAPPTVDAVSDEAGPLALSPGTAATYAEPEPPGRWWGQLFQFHIVLSCLVLVLISCVVLGLASMTILQWLVEGGV